MLTKLGWSLLLACVAIAVGRALIAPHDVTAAKQTCAQQFSGDTARQHCINRVLDRPNAAPDVHFSRVAPLPACDPDKPEVFACLPKWPPL